jgi:hypothetical protein
MDKWLRRMVIRAAVAIAGSGYSLVFGGATFPECLGPLGVTGVQCVAHGGRLPTDPLWPPMVVVSCALGALIAFPAKRSWIDGVAGVGGVIAGVLISASIRTMTLEGPDYDGTWLVIPVPIDPWGVFMWAAAGFVVALVGTGLVRLGTELPPGRRAIDALRRRSRPVSG